MKEYDLSGCYSADYEDTSRHCYPHRAVVFKTLEALLNFSDLIVVADDSTPILNAAGQALRALKHVIISQPEKLKNQEVKELLKLAEESDTQIIFGEGYLTNPLLKIIQNQMSHPFWIEMNRGLFSGLEKMKTELPGYLRKDIEFILQCTEGEILKAHAKSGSVTGTEGVVGCQLEMDSGCVLSLNYFANAPATYHTLKINQQGSVITADFVKNSLMMESVGPDSGPQEISEFQRSPEEIRILEISKMIKSISGQDNQRFKENIKAILLTHGLMTKIKFPVLLPPQNKNFL